MWLNEGMEETETETTPIYCIYRFDPSDGHEVYYSTWADAVSHPFAVDLVIDGEPDWTDSPFTTEAEAMAAAEVHAGHDLDWHGSCNGPAALAVAS